MLLTFSLLFYFAGEGIYLLLMLGSILWAYLTALWLDKKTGKTRKVLICISVIGNLLPLLYFKYADFFIDSINGIVGSSLPLFHTILPLGISFYTFQLISYTIDVYRGNTPVQKNFGLLALYLSLFPQLVAGPIVRYTDVNDALQNRTHTPEQFAVGCRRFTIGLAKKVLIANVLGELIAQYDRNATTVVFVWVYGIAVALQLYFDFSGYSDMAIGLGHIFGFTFPENFRYPYMSSSVSEFWRRWHMTLGSFFRDYVYIPLGGNRCSMLKWLRNVIVVWFLTGFWHGAGWTFPVWGLFFAVWLIIEKVFSAGIARIPMWIRHVGVCFLVMISFMLFHVETLGQAVVDVSALFGISLTGNALPLYDMVSLYHIRNYAVILIIAMIGASPLPLICYRKLCAMPKCGKVMPWASAVCMGAVLLLGTAYLVDGSFNPFLYFRF